jgi:hypothetical protein
MDVMPPALAIRQEAQLPLRVNRYRVRPHREPLNVRFAPRATELLRRSEMSRRANSRRLTY